MKRFLMASFLTALVACGDPAEPELNVYEGVVPVPTEMTLRVGEEQAVGGSVVRIQFVDVLQDSRCPIDVVCVWQGNALVELGIRAGTGPTFSLKVNTTLEPQAAEWNGLKVTLLELEPAPRAATPIPLEDYRATIRVEGAS